MCGHRAVSHNALVSHLRIHTLDAPKCKRCHHSCLDCTTMQERIKAIMKNNPQSLLDTAFELGKVSLSQTLKLRSIYLGSILNYISTGVEPRKNREPGRQRGIEDQR